MSVCESTARDKDPGILQSRKESERATDSRQIIYGVILLLLHHMRETGHLMPDKRRNVVVGRARTVRNEEAILRIVNDALEMSIRWVSREVAIYFDCNKSVYLAHFFYLFSKR